ncbi:MAG: helix-turn-helix domain-containing protein [Salinivirgaceae bacterium]
MATTFFAQNIKLLRKRLKRTQDEVASALNMKRSTLSGYENGIASPGLSALLNIADYFGIAVDTLIRVNMSELSESQLSELERGFDTFVKGSRLRVLTTTVDSNNDENIELVPEKAKAGYTTGYADPEYIRELPVFKLPFLDRQKKYRTFQVSGDSMLPIPDGAWVTGEYIQNWSTISTNTPCIFVTRDEGIVFKIVENKLQSNEKFRLYSLNTFYDPFDMHANDIIEIWRFTHFISKQMPSPGHPQAELVSTITQLKTDIDSIKQQLKNK